MELWEVQKLSESLVYANSIDWQTARLISYFVASPYMKERKGICEFFPLPTDVEMKEEHIVEITDNEIEEMKKYSQIIEGKMKRGGL